MTPAHQHLQTVCPKWRLPGLFALLLTGLLTVLPAPAQTTNQPAQIDELKSQINDAMDQVRKIVNQPVYAYRRQPDMRVSEFSPGWFHQGANIPDFINVDVRTTQERIYDKFEYVTSDLNPGLVFHGVDLEFNANTKYFYVNRSIPKKKLTEAEMLEINRLYRIIGHSQARLARLQSPPVSETAPDEVEQNTAAKIVTQYPILKSTAARIILVVVLVLGVVYLIQRRVVSR